MQEMGPMMRALELQRLIEDKVSEWRERSARVAGASVAEYYQQPVNFRRRANKRKNSAEINRIIAKYSNPVKRVDERHATSQTKVPERPDRHKKYSGNLKSSKSEDNLSNIRVMESSPDPPADIKPPPRVKLSKYNAKSCEDITAFVDVALTNKSKNFQQNSILNAKTVNNSRPQLHSIHEDSLDVTRFKDSAIGSFSSSFATSTPLSKRKTYSEGDSISVVSGFQKCTNFGGTTVLRKGSSEPDILSATKGPEPITKTLDARSRWRLLKQPFRKGAFHFLLPWKGKKTRVEKDR